MEERVGVGRLTQRRFEVGENPAPEPPPPSLEAVEAPPAPAVLPPNPDRPVAPSNVGLLDRQQQWMKERSRFDARKTEPGASR